MAGNQLYGARDYAGALERYGDALAAGAAHFEAAAARQRAVAAGKQRRA